MANSVVYGIFSTRDQVETAVDAMQREGFRNADISVLFTGTETTVPGGALGSLTGTGIPANPRLWPGLDSGLDSDGLSIRTGSAEGPPQ